jgi:hypothetical protein
MAHAARRILSIELLSPLSDSALQELIKLNKECYPSHSRNREKIWMQTSEFISAVRRYVREEAISANLSIISDPPGRASKPNLSSCQSVTTL